MLEEKDPKHIYFCPGCDRYFYMLDPEHDGYLDSSEAVAHKLREGFVGEMACLACSAEETHPSIRATED